MKCWRYLNRKWGLKALETGLFKMSTRNEFNDVLDSVGCHCGRYTKEYIEKRVLADERHEYDKLRYEEMQRRFPKGSERIKYERELRDGLSDRICRNLNYEEQHHLIPGKPDMILCMSMDRDEHDKAVARRMKELGLNNTTLARRMKISRPYVVKVLRGDVNISLGAAARFAKALGMDFVPTLVPRQEKGGGDSGKEEGRVKKEEVK